MQLLEHHFWKTFMKTDPYKHNKCLKNSKLLKVLLVNTKDSFKQHYLETRNTCQWRVKSMGQYCKYRLATSVFLSLSLSHWHKSHSKKAITHFLLKPLIFSDTLLYTNPYKYKMLALRNLIEINWVSKYYFKRYLDSQGRHWERNLGKLIEGF